MRKDVFGLRVCLSAAVSLFLGLAGGFAQDDEVVPTDLPAKKEKVSIDTKEPGWREQWRKKRQEKRDYRVHLLRGLVAQEDGNHKAAIGHFEKAIKYNAQCAQAYCQIGACQAEMGKTVDAVGSLMTATRISPDLKTAYYQLGLVYLRQYRVEAAEEQVEKLKPLDPKLADELVKAIAAKKEAIQKLPSGSQ
jgi:tetratricopeptide (TPR) repeat protein